VALLVHAALLLFFLRDNPANPPAAQTLFELRFLAAPREPERPRTPRPSGRAVQGIARIQEPSHSVPLPEVAQEPTATAISPQAPRALQLSLPAELAASNPRPASMLSQMLNDPRTRRINKRTVEFAVADAAGTLQVTVQASTDGTNSQLIRQGSKCIRVTEARIKTLNPMDDNARGVSSVSGPCFKD